MTNPIKPTRVCDLIHFQQIWFLAKAALKNYKGYQFLTKLYRKLQHKKSNIWHNCKLECFPY